MEQAFTNKLPLKILYVEDDFNIRDNTLEILRRRIEEVITATNGLEGLELYKAEGADVVITDIKMPRMDGLTMSEHIRELNPAQHIIIISAYNETEYLSKAIELGVDGFVLKPFQWNRLIGMISKIAESIWLEKELSEKNQLIAENQALLESMLNSATKVAILSADTSLRITNYNQVLDQWLRRFNRPTTWLYEPVLNLWPGAETRKKMEAWLEKALKGQPADGIEDPLWDTSGELLYELNIWPIQNKDNRSITGVTLLINDISEKKKTREQLEKYKNHLEDLVKTRTDELLASEFKYKNLIERLNDGLVISRENTIVYANAALGRLIGEDPKNLEGADIIRLFSQQAGEHVRNIHEKRLRGEAMPEIYETQITNSKQQNIPVELNVSKVNPDDLLSHIIIIRDLSNRNAIEKERNKLAIAVGQIGEGVVVTDTQGTIELCE